MPRSNFPDYLDSQNLRWCARGHIWYSTDIHECPGCSGFRVPRTEEELERIRKSAGKEWSWRESLVPGAQA